MEVKQNRYLFVVAHPDDEVLGAGGTIFKLAHEGATVNVCILCGGAEARSFRPDTKELTADMYRSMETLGVAKVYPGAFLDSRLNMASHLEVVQFIESAIVDSNAQQIITHHPNDLHNDHRLASLACQEAARISMRRIVNVPALTSLSYMEVLSSTDWALNTSNDSFKPDTFVEIGEEGVQTKIEALSQYRYVMRDFPHPRSEQIIKGLAAYRGGQAGCQYAEAFETAFRREL